jgi:hypothetical protein
LEYTNYEDRIVSIQQINLYLQFKWAFNIILQAPIVKLLALLMLFIIKLVIMDCTEIEGGQSKLKISNHSIIRIIMYCIFFEGEHLLIATQTQGFELEQEVLSKFNTEVD